MVCRETPLHSLSRSNVKPPWLDPGTAYELLRRPKESAATEFFVVPATRSVPDWIAMVVNAPLSC